MPQVDQTTKDAHHLCWSCREEVGEGPFCQNCISIQPADEFNDYFSLFGLRPSYKIDHEYLRNKYYQLSRQFHPDFYAGKSEHEQRLARDNSAYLNSGYKVLNDPILLAEYILKTRGGSFETKPAPPQELFEEILEIGELLVDGQTLDDSERETLEKALTDFVSRQQDLIISLEPAFEQYLKNDESRRVKIVERLNNIRYLRTIINRIENRLKNKA